MKYKRFEELPVWQKAAELYELTEGLLDDDMFIASRGFRDQLERAALSVSNNIAEGFERGTTKELIHFVYIARASAGEVRSMATVKEHRGERNVWAPRVCMRCTDLKEAAMSCSRQLRAWAASLQRQSKTIRGHQYLEVVDPKSEIRNLRSEI